jgi:hypothetical protein
MAIFTLKRYEENKEVKKEPSGDEQQQKTVSAGDPVKKEDNVLVINVSDTVADIVSKALFKTLQNVEIVQTEDDDCNTDMDVNSTDIVTTEDINNDPIESFNRIKKTNAVFISSKQAFSTEKEEWFLMNIKNKTNNVFYTMESFIKYVKESLAV